MRLGAVIVVASILAGCGGGGGAASSPATSGNAPTTAPTTAPQIDQVQLRVVIADSSTSGSAAARHAQFVSTSTEGLLVQVYAHADTSHSTLLASSAANVGASSRSCTTVSNERSCIVSVSAPTINDDFVLTTYDQPPNAGSDTFSQDAKVLAIGTITTNIVANASNIISVALDGVIASLQLGPTLASALTGSPYTYGLTINALDADGNIIVAGAADPYNTPIGIAISSQSPSLGHILLTLGGPTGTGSTSVQVTQSSQTVTMLFDGLGAYPYSAVIQATTAGAAATTVQFQTIDIVRANPTSLSFSDKVMPQTVQFEQLGAPGSNLSVTKSCQPGAELTFSPTTGATTGFTVTVTALSAPLTPSATAACTLNVAGFGLGTGSSLAIPVNIATPGLDSSAH